MAQIKLRVNTENALKNVKGEQYRNMVNTMKTLYENQIPEIIRDKELKYNGQPNIDFYQYVRRSLNSTEIDDNGLIGRKNTGQQTDFDRLSEIAINRKSLNPSIVPDTSISPPGETSQENRLIKNKLSDAPQRNQSGSKTKNLTSRRNSIKRSSSRKGSISHRTISNISHTDKSKKLQSDVSLKKLSKGSITKNNKNYSNNLKHKKEKSENKESFQSTSHAINENNNKTDSKYNSKISIKSYKNSPKTSTRKYSSITQKKKSSKSSYSSYESKDLGKYKNGSSLKKFSNN